MTPVLPSLRLEPVGMRRPMLPALPKRLRVDAAPQPLQLAQAHGLELRPSLSAEQMAALALATGGMYQPATAAHRRETVPTTSEDWKKARRKEQCRINQANYRKRKRQYEQRLMDEIQGLEHEIARLETRRYSEGGSDPIQAIGDFYFALGVEGGQQQQRMDVRHVQLADGGSPALQHLMDLQREEFDSIESIKLHWLWYREQFRIFQLSIASCERLEAGEQVVIKLTGHLLLDVFYDSERGEGSEGYGAVSCPFVQQFEFEAGEQAFTRITSEVDLVAGVAAAQDQSSPECTMSVLRCLSEGFTMSTRYHAPRSA